MSWSVQNLNADTRWHRRVKHRWEQAGLGEAKVTKQDDATDQLWNVLILASSLET